jgi:hypothetical protein
VVDTDETRRVTRLSRVERVHGPSIRHQGLCKRGNEKRAWERPLEPLLPRPTKHSQRWMTVRPQHHRQPPPRRRRHWRRLLYSLPHPISLLCLLFRPRHNKTESVPATRSVHCRQPVLLPNDSSSTFFDIPLSLSISLYSPTSLIRVNGNTRRQSQLSHQSAL